VQDQLPQEAWLGTERRVKVDSLAQSLTIFLRTLLINGKINLCWSSPLIGPRPRHRGMNLEERNLKCCRLLKADSMLRRINKLTKGPLQQRLWQEWKEDQAWSSTSQREDYSRRIRNRPLSPLEMAWAVVDEIIGQRSEATYLKWVNPRCRQSFTIIFRSLLSTLLKVSASWESHLIRKERRLRSLPRPNECHGP
jgi:hypothetical protein